MKISRTSGETPQNAPAPQPKTQPTPAPAPKPRCKPKPEPEYEEDDDEEEEEHRRHFPVGCLIVIIILALVGFGAYKGMQFYSEIDGGTDLGAEQTVSIEQGSSVSSIATQLKDAGIIQYDWLFKQYAKYSGKADGIQYGDFTLRSGMSYNDIIKTLSEVVRRATTNVTIPEGTTAVGVAQIFVDAGLVDDVDTFLNCANGTDGSDFSQYDFWNQILDNGRLMKCEGYLYPETYNVYTDEDVYYYVDTMYSEFANKTAALADTIGAPRSTTRSSWPASFRRRPVSRVRMPRSAPASTTVLSPTTRSGPSISWNPTPAAISCGTARTTTSGTLPRPSTTAGRIRAPSPTMCWLSTTPIPSAACPPAPSPTPVTPPLRLR